MNTAQVNLPGNLKATHTSGNPVLQGAFAAYTVTAEEKPSSEPKALPQITVEELASTAVASQGDSCSYELPEIPEDGINVNLPVDKLILTWFNPGIRIDRADKDFIRLKESIASNGVKNEIKVVYDRATGQLLVSDGNRRVSCCQDLGISTIRAQVVEPLPGESLEKAIYRTYSLANDSRVEQKMNTRQQIMVWLSGAKEVVEQLNSTTAKRIAYAEKLLGSAFLKQMVDNGGSLDTYNVSMQAMRYCAAPETTVYAQRVVSWVQKYKLSGAIREYIAQRKLPRKMIECIKHDEPLKMRSSKGKNKRICKTVRKTAKNGVLPNPQ